MPQAEALYSPRYFFGTPGNPGYLPRIYHSKPR